MHVFETLMVHYVVGKHFSPVSVFVLAYKDW